MRSQTDAPHFMPRSRDRITKQALKVPESESIMGNITKPKKATFLVSKDKNGHRIFTAVNKRAHTVAKKAGKRTKLTVADLKALKNTGTYKYFQYTDTGTLKAIQL